MRGSQLSSSEIVDIQNDISNLQSDLITLDSTMNLRIDFVRDNLENLTDREEIAKNYLRTNQSFLNMFYDDFIDIDKTNITNPNRFVSYFEEQKLETLGEVDIPVKDNGKSTDIDKLRNDLNDFIKAHKCFCE